MELHPAQLSQAALRKKRVFDVGLVSLALPFVLPLMAVIAVAVRLDGAGPIMFRQRRAGQDGRVFHILKFRTMEVGAEARRDQLLARNEVDGPLFKIKNDPRMTRIGRLLRRTSLDELPQLFNVLRGQMSLVGPRPFEVGEDAAITGWARRRLDLTPGITGLWQVSGRNDLSFDEMVKLDYLYVTRWSLWWDVRILAQTIPAVLRRRGAY
jgi:lipopolysaccharide/colanic/teichoic acid biosynthesis glycosyltransferase